MVGVLIIILKKTFQQKCQYLKKELSRKKSICDVSAQASSIVYTLDWSNSTLTPLSLKSRPEIWSSMYASKFKNLQYDI